MKLKIYKNEKFEDPVDVIIYHDINGNIFMKTVNTIKIEKKTVSEIEEKKSDTDGANDSPISKTEDVYYFLAIDATDNLEWVKIEDYNSLELVKPTVPYCEIKNTYNKNSLKGKILKELDDNEIDELYTSDPEDDAEYKIKHKSYPEDRYYMIDREEVSDDEYECKYNFSKSGDETIIEPLNRTLGSSSGYDTFVMDESTSFVLTTMESDEKCSYRITLFTSGRMALNIVGSKIKLFNTIYTVDATGNKNFITNVVKTNIIVY